MTVLADVLVESYPEPWCPRHRRPMRRCTDAWVRNGLTSAQLDECIARRRPRRDRDRERDPDRECIDCRARLDYLTEWTVWDDTLGRAFRPYCYPCGSKTVRVERSIRA